MKQVEFTPDFSSAPITDAPLSIHDRADLLDIELTGPFVRTQSGAILCVDKVESNKTQQAWLSEDEGKTWQAYPIFNNPHFAIYDDHALCVSRSGRVYLSFLNLADYHFNWVKHKNAPTKNSALSQWIVWSDDHGKTWQQPVLIQAGYAASIRSLLELDDGCLVVSAQNLDYANARHYALSFVSTDQGQTWQASNRLDMPGRGHHDGCYEGCLLPLRDGRLWYLIRTNMDWFWHAYSIDQGRTWTQLQPGLAASSSPGMLTRLNSGRIMLVYNPLEPLLADTTALRRRGGQFSEREASWFRSELVVRFSADEGQTWTEPQVLARMDKAWLSYPHVFEVSPGKIWLTTMQTRLKLCFNDTDLG